LIESPFKVIIHEASAVVTAASSNVDEPVVGSEETPSPDTKQPGQLKQESQVKRAGSPRGNTAKQSKSHPAFEFKSLPPSKTYYSTPARIEYELNNWNLQLNQTLKIMESTNAPGSSGSNSSAGNNNQGGKRALTPITDTSEEESNGQSGKQTKLFQIICGNIIICGGEKKIQLWR
jgi:hypothetical protein